MTTTPYKRGDIVLYPFSFAEDKTRFKRRPALIVQSDDILHYSGNYLIAYITTKSLSGPTRICIEKGSVLWEGTGLLDTSYVLTERIEVFNAEMLIAKIGHLSDMQSINQALRVTFALN